MSRPTLIAAFCLALAARAVADEPPPVTPETAADADVVKARERFRIGQERFAAHDYEAALREFEAARLIKAVAEFDFNIAVCLEHLGKAQEAIGTYRTFIDETVDPAALADARARIAKLEAAEAPKPAPVAAPPIVAAPAPSPRSYTAPIVLGVGALALAAIATAVMVPVFHEYDQVSASWDRMPTPQLAAEADYLKTRLEVSYALFATAGVAAVIDLVLWIRSGHRESNTVSASAHASRNALLVGGSF